MGIPLFDLMKYGMGLAAIAAAPAQQALLLVQGAAAAGLGDTETAEKADAGTETASPADKAAAPDRAAA